ncbi:GIY-YIG nuclease family protein [Patescibacteria group bacterium]|nr:GIY-YIG nuclease family protein [Patescibacteria group bacterium]MBU4098511.1 GIY-YIG nuclease family protein [Patescibacteria group bacterium]
MRKTYCVYILTNNSGTLYIGITSNLIKRLWEHKNKVVKGFTEKYNIYKLIYYEIYENVEQAILREKQLKNWNRKKKLALIRKTNPKFEELVINE